MVRYEAYSRRAEMSLLKVLGGGSLQVAAVFLTESALLAALSTAVGACASLLMSWGLMKFVFDSELHADWPLFAAAVAGSVALSLALTAAASASVWREKPAKLLHGPG